MTLVQYKKIAFLSLSVSVIAQGNLPEDSVSFPT